MNRIIPPASFAIAPLPHERGRYSVDAVPAGGREDEKSAVILRVMPPFGDLLVCGISRQLRQRVANFDEVITTTDADFVASGLMGTSLIRLGFLALLPMSEFLGDIGSVSTERHHRLLRRLAKHLQEPALEL